MVIDSHPGPSSPDGDDALVLRAPTAGRLAVHRRDCDTLAAEHVGQHVRGVVARHHQQRLQQLAGGVRLARLQSHAGALDLGMGLIGAGEVVGPQVVEHHHRQQRLDRAGGRVLRVRITRGQDAAGVEVGQQPRLGWTVRERYRPGRLDSRLCGRGRTTTADVARASAVANAANIFRTER